MSTRAMNILLALAVTVLFVPAAHAQGLLTTPTLKLEMTCSPLNLTLPGDLVFQVEAINLTDHPRVYWGRINVAMGEGQVIRNWRLEFEQNIGGRQSYHKQFRIRIPALPGLSGNHRFKCGAFDVTPPGMTRGIPAGFHAWAECIVGMDLP